MPEVDSRCHSTNQGGSNMPPHTWNSWQRPPRGQHGVVEHHDSMTTAQQAFRAGSCTTERHSRSTPKPPRRDAGSGKTRAPRSRASQLRCGHHLRRDGIEKGQAGEHQVKHEQVMGNEREKLGRFPARGGQWRWQRCPWVHAS